MVLQEMSTLEAKVGEIAQHRDRDWAIKNFQRTIRELIQLTEAKSVFEVGGGRHPFLKRDFVEEQGIDYSSSDILASELALAPEWVSGFVFDIQTQDPEQLDPLRNKFDFAFSKWVMEHVGDFKLAYGNIYEILREGGVYVALHPVLHALPFTLNSMMSEDLSARLLRTFFPHRNDEETPKFPALYSGCKISEPIRREIKALGFRNVWQLPFYGHNYYSKIPVLREAHGAVTNALSSANATFFASFSYTIVQR